MILELFFITLIFELMLVTVGFYIWLLITALKIQKEVQELIEYKK